MPTPGEKILVALSGGVDSSVAALLLQRQGYRVSAAYMKNWINEDNLVGECPWQQDIADARAVAERLGIDFQVVNLMRDYRERVVEYLLDGYARGLTPNPDIRCNREIKFGVFRAWAKDHGFAAVATGHYARRVPLAALPAPAPAPSHPAPSHPAPATVPPDARHVLRDRRSDSPAPVARHAFHDVTPGAVAPAPVSTRPAGHLLDDFPSVPPTETTCHPLDDEPAGGWALLEGADKNKDQSYFLARLSPEQLAEARFPIGHLTKPELRALARDAGLPTAAKKDSQGICFIGQVKMADFLRAYVPDAPGPIVRATDGRVLGTHRGLHFYTLGQRRGIGIPSNTDHRAYVVVGKRAANRALLVAFDQPDAPGLFQSEVRVHSLSWLGAPLTAPGEIEGRVRYRDPRIPLRFEPEGGGTARIVFATPQRGLASGQVLALYVGERLLGGGVYG